MSIGQRGTLLCQVLCRALCMALLHFLLTRNLSRCCFPPEDLDHEVTCAKSHSIYVEEFECWFKPFLNSITLYCILT